MFWQASRISNGFWRATLAAAAFVIVAAATEARAASCSPSVSAEPGWLAVVYKGGAKTSGLSPDAPLRAFPLTRMPTKFGDMLDVRRDGDLRRYAIRANWHVCEAGRYDLALVLEAARNDWGRALLCNGHMDVGTTRVFAVNQPGSMAMVDPGMMETKSGFIQLEPGIYPITLELACGAQFYGNSRTTMLKGPDPDFWDASFTLRVRAPKELTPREFRMEEVSQRAD